MARKRDNVTSFRKPFRAVPLRRVKNRPPTHPPQGTSWRQAFRAMRGVLAVIALVTVAVIAAMPGAFEPPGFMQSEPERIDGRFTRCGPGRGYYCVVDGDTFKLGQRSVRVVGIDTAEVDARCEAEAAQAEASTAALQRWLNRGPFRMTARLDDPTDRYGRDLRIVKRLNPDGSEDRLADYMRKEGGARGYYGGGRNGWC